MCVMVIVIPYFVVYSFGQQHCEAVTVVNSCSEDNRVKGWLTVGSHEMKSPIKRTKKVKEKGFGFT